ncbi:hypothetical protein ACFQ9X_33945 [Catenulispora yoronensis]
MNRLTAQGAAGAVLPRKVVVHGDDSHAVAEAISQALPNVDVIGARGSVGSLKSGRTVAGAVAALGNRFLLQGNGGGGGSRIGTGSRSRFRPSRASVT